MNRSLTSSLFAFFCLACSLCASIASAQTEYIILSGGPALRQWENLRKPGEQHDRW